MFCILDSCARESFTEAERDKLVELADEAGAEIAKWQEAERQVKIKKLSGKRTEWAKRTSVLASEGRVLDDILEVATPVLEQSDPFEDARRGSDSSSTFSAILTSELAPCWFRRTPGRAGLYVATSKTVPAKIKSVLDLSTSLIGETLGLDFTCFISCTLNPPPPSPGSSADAKTGKLSLLSTHNLPIPSFYDYDLHESVFGSDPADHALLFVNSVAPKSGDFSSGLIMRVGTAGNMGYALAGYTEDPSRVLGREDLHFFSSFAQDLSKYLVDL